MTKLAATILAGAMAGMFAGGVAAAGESGVVGKKIDDVTLVTRIKTDLLQSDGVEGLSVNVDARQGHVTLSGHADSERERDHAEASAKGTDGVRSVENRIELRPD